MSGYRPPGTFGVLWLLATTSLKRLLRATQIAQSKRAMRGDTGGGKASRRTATRRKGGGLMWLMVLMLPIFLFQANLMSTRGIHKLWVAAERTEPGNPMVLGEDFYWQTRKNQQYDEQELVAMLDEAGIDERSRPRRSQILRHWREHGEHAFVPDDRGGARLIADAFDWRNPDTRRLFVRCAAVLLTALWLMTLFVGFGGANATLAGGGWTQAWLATFPVRTRSLVLARALEYALVQFFPWLTLFPFGWQVMRALGQPHAWLVALLGTLSAVVLTGALRLWLETSLRMRCSLMTLRNIQGACTILGLSTMAFVFGMLLGPATPFWFVDACAVLPVGVTLLPGAWPLASGAWGVSGLLVGPLLGIVAFVAAVAMTTRLLQHGAMVTGGVDAGSRGGSKRWRRGRRIGVLGKDLLLLRRDRNLMVQTLLVPVFILGLQLLVNPAMRLGESGHAGASVAVIAYFVGAYGSLNGCFQVLSGEGRALWMLYTMPVPIAVVLRQKTRIWALVAVGFALVAMVLMSLRGGSFAPGRLLYEAGFVVFGVWCAAHIAAAVGVIGANPTSDHVPKQPKARHVYLFLFFMSSYVATLLANTPAGRIAGVVAFGTLAFAFWQRAQQRLQWLLDPVDERRDHVTLFDGAAAVVVFLLLQGLITLVVARGSADLFDVTLGFVIGGAVTVAVFLLVLKLRGAALTAEFGLRVPARRAVLAGALGVALGAGLGLLGLLYASYVGELGWVELPEIAARDRATLLWLAVLAAPIVEEMLFRGMVFGGLARSVRPTLAAVWSAALFTAVHPTHSWPPVFAVGIASALLYHRTRFLPAAMLLHATYNAIVVGYQ